VTAKDLYDRDFFEWTQCNAALLRSGQFDRVDIEHVAEEIEDMGKSQRHELRSRLRILIMHLLKWRYRPDRRGSSWIRTIGTQRAEIADLLKDAPSLRNALAEHLGGVYEEAARLATQETRAKKDVFPERCPFSEDEILDPEFFPESAGYDGKSGIPA